MDWLTFKFCVLIWFQVLWVSKSQSQLQNSTIKESSRIGSSPSQPSCEEGQPVTPPDECNTCTCFAGVIYCTNLSCPERKCEADDGKEVSPPDECNKCICIRGQVMCSNVICIPAPNCSESLTYPTKNKCNTCKCIKGFITCTSNICYDENLQGFDPRAQKQMSNKEVCIEGSNLPASNKCVECFCEKSKKRCKYICSPTMQLQSRFGDQSHDFCEEGQPIVPPDECNTCKCFSGVIYCTNLPCAEKKCVNDEEIPPPDACNKCICRQGQIMCSQVLCISAPNCAENQMYPAPNKCNTCMCLNGYIRCTSNACYEENWAGFDPRATTETPNRVKCIEGSVIPGPNKCMECFCENGRKRCKYVCEPIKQLESRYGDHSESSCVIGQPIVPPDECNTCTCFAGLIYCTKHKCTEQECVHGEELPSPDECNKCVCQRGQVTCSDMICIPAPNCADRQLFPPPNKCNACMCVNGFITCTSNVCHDENWAGFETREPPPDDKECSEGTSLPAPNKCYECFCEKGTRKCHFVCSPTMQLHNRFAEPECLPDQIILSDDCNHCICFEGEIHCTEKICRPEMRIGQECRDDQPVLRPDDCNECHCIDGRLECSDLVCIRGSKCVPGQEIPKPDECNSCKCVEGHIICTNHQCPKLDPRTGLPTRSSPTDVNPLDACKEGDVLPILPPPHDCNKCYCIDNVIMCTVNTCVTSVPEIKGRFKEQNEQNNLQNFDKQISLEPFIDILYKKNNKLPAKLIHTHNYNGFHQEIKVHANHLPKDATSLLKVLASSLDNPALASISQSLLTSPDTSNQKVVPNNLLGEGNVITTQSSKLITSGSQSNRTILVIPNTEPFESHNPQSTMPLTNEHETIWKTVSAPATIVYHNNQPIKSRNNPEENMNVRHDDIPSPILNSIQPSDITRNPTRFSRPGQPRTLQNPTGNTLHLNTQNKPILIKNNVNDGKKNYGPLYQENNQFKPVPSVYVSKLNNLPPVAPFGPGKLIAAPSVHSGQQKPLSPFVPNQPNNYPNRFKPEEFPVISNENQPSHILIPTFNKKALQNPLLPNTQNQPTVSALPQNEPMHTQLVPNPSIYYKNEYEAPKINEVNPDVKQLLPHSKTSYTLTEHQRPTTFPKLDRDAIIPKVRNKTKRYNTTHSHYEKHTSLTYVSDFDPNDPAHKKIGGHNPNQHYNAPPTNQYQHYSPDQSDLDLTRSKVNFYLNLPNNQPQLNSQTPFIPSGPQSQTNSAEYPIPQKNNEQLISQTGPTIPNVYQDLKKVKPDHEPEIFDERGSSDGFKYLSNSVEDLTHPKIAQNQHKPGMLVEGEYHFAHNANQNPAHLKPVYQLPNIPFDPTLIHDKAGINHNPPLNPKNIQHALGIDERGSGNGFQYPSNSAEDPSHSKGNKLPGIIKNLGPAGEFPYPLNSAEKSSYPKDSQHPPQSKENLSKPTLLPLGPTQNQQLPNVHYLPQSAENPSYPKQQQQPDSPYDPTKKQPLPGKFDERGSGDSFQYPSLSAGDPSHAKPYMNGPPNSPYGPPSNQQKPGMFDERESGAGFQYPSHSAEEPSHPKPNMNKPPNSAYGPIPNQHKPGMFDERGSADGFQYPSHSAEEPSQPIRNNNKPPNSPYGPPPNQQKPGMSDERGSGDGFQYPSHSAEDPSHPKPNMNKPPNSPYGPPPNQHKPGMLDERGSGDGFQYPSYSAEDPLHPKPNMNKPPNSPYGPPPNQQKPEMLDERGSGDGFQYPPHSAEDSSHPKPNMNKPPNSPYGLPPNQQKPGMLDERGSGDGFQYPSHSAEDPSHPKPNMNKPPNSPYGPPPNPPGIFDERGSGNRFQYPSHSAEDPSHPKPNINKPPNSPFGPPPNPPGMFDERGSGDGLQYPSHSTEDPSHAKPNNNKPPNSPYGPPPNQHKPGMFDERGSADGFQYQSHSAEDASHPKQNINKPPNSPYGPPPNQQKPGMLDERGSGDGFQYPSHSAEDSSHLIPNINKPSNSPYGPQPNQHKPGMFDERGSGDGFTYPSYSAENPLNTKNNKHYPIQPQFQPPHNQFKGFNDKQSNIAMDPIRDKHLPGMFDEGFQNPSHQAQRPLQTKNLKNSPQSQFIPSDNHYNKQPYSPFDPNLNKHYAEDLTKLNSKLPHSPINPTPNQPTQKLDERGSDDGFQYPSNSTENKANPKDKTNNLPQSLLLPFDYQYNEDIHKQPNVSFGPTQKEYLPVVSDAEQSSSGENATHPESVTQNFSQPQVGPAKNHQNDDIPKPSDFPFGPTLINSLPEVLEVRGSADGYQYPSHSAEEPTQQKNNSDTTPDSALISEIFDDNHDEKPSSFEDLVNGVKNIPWSLPEDNKEVSKIVTSSVKPSLEPDSASDNPLNGVYDTPWSTPEDHEKVLSAITSAPKTRVKPEYDQYKPSFSISFKENEDNDGLETDAEITTPQNYQSREDGNEQQLEKDISASTTELKNSDSTQIIPHPKIGNDLTIDDDIISDYYNKLYPLFNAVKKLSEPPTNNSALNVDQLDLLPDIANIMNYEPEKDQDDALSIKDHGPQSPSLLKIKSKFKLFPLSGNGILNWLKSKLLKYVPQKHNVTVNPNEFDITNIFHMLKKIMEPKTKDNVAQQNIPFSGLDPDIIETLFKVFQEDTSTTTPTPRIDTAHNFGDRFNTMLTEPDENGPLVPESKYPEVHIILHQPNDEGDLPPYMETEGAGKLPSDTSYEDLDDPLSKVFEHRFRHRHKDQKDECGDGTHWISNCHSCYCYFGRPICHKMKDCVLRSFGEPMSCKPYSHFKMGCYSCECNGDGVSECDATYCNPKSSGKIGVTTEEPLPIFNEFLDSKKTDEIVQYYDSFKKLPKECPMHGLQVQYPTCERGTSWVSSCHKCDCNDNGQHECVKIGDCKLDLYSHGKPSRCKPNSKFYPKTNSLPCIECSCNDEGQPYCPEIDPRKH